MPPEPPEEFFSRSEFARRSRLSAKALRIYDEVGLLRPAEIDPSSGYRRYAPDQLHAARLIGMLRGSSMSLAEIRSFLVAMDEDSLVAADLLDAHLVQLEAHHASRKALVRHVRSILREGGDSMFTIQTRHVPARRVMSIQRRLHAPETDAFVAEAKHAFAQHLGGQPPTGPFVLIFHGVVDEESDGPIEATLGCSDSVEPTELIGIRTEEAHDEAFTTITKAEWAYPAILAAYDAVACSPEAMSRPGGRLSCREVYLVEPDAISDEELLCEIAFPLGERTVA